MTDALYPVIGKQTELPFYLTGIGISDPEMHVVRNTGLSSHQFLLTESGSGVLYVDGREYPQEKGSLFYLAPGKPHEYHPAGNDWVTSWLVFRGVYSHALLKSIGFDGFAYKPSINSSRLEKIFQRIFSAAGDPVNGGENASVLVYEYILAAREAMLCSAAVSPEKNNIAKEALMYIDKSFMQDIAIETLAGLSGVSVQHFCRVFKAETMMRPLEYIARRRISEAKSLLSDTSLEIGEIGRMVGYPDRNYFSIVFRRLEGVSPREYRRNKGSAVM
ncbi:MAG: AraC family transcriptional regulator [Oscillospiraceae bacterium]|nr:AraC family transcriptional regulator [Oscillospiraceae bacterium]